jgi:hypothetical protein
MELLFTARDWTEAHLVKLALEKAGIPTSIHEQLPTFTVWFAPSTLPKPEVFVNAEDMAGAEAVLEDFLRQGIREDEPDAWTCVICGEEVEGVFDECWNCESPRESTNTQTRNLP